MTRTVQERFQRLEMTNCPDGRPGCSFAEDVGVQKRGTRDDDVHAPHATGTNKQNYVAHLHAPHPAFVGFHMCEHVAGKT